MKRTLDTVFRVIRLSRELKNALRNQRTTRGITNEQFIREAIETNLPGLLLQLQALGFGKSGGHMSPARLPFSIEAGKRQRTLPAGPCTVYDLLNFASEVATHHSDEYGSRCCQAWIGQLVSGEYDLELSRQSFGEFKDFFMERNLNGEVARDLERAGA
jgi:hypothetical protein